MKPQRIGIFGGTFDPPHVGHLILAAEAQDQLRLDRLLWVLTPDPPHKQNQRITPLEIRVRLLQAAIGDNRSFELCRVEMDRPGPHYAVDTVRILKDQVSSAEMFYLIGGDSLHDLPTWYQPQQLIELIDGLGVMRRPGDQVDLSELEQKIPGIALKIRFIEAPLLEISARQIRQRISEGRAYRYYVPPGVYQLIEELGVYHLPSSSVMRVKS
ncbi:MAG: nicotinate-nucleotide adenylyltransferase [Bellilinea sp.]|nr:MAG: nicotinate-nucleotide adenylyltransferase [Bellilinea sp.]